MMYDRRGGMPRAGIDGDDVGVEAEEIGVEVGEQDGQAIGQDEQPDEPEALFLDHARAPRSAHAFLR